MPEWKVILFFFVFLFNFGVLLALLFEIAEPIYAFFGRLETGFLLDGAKIFFQVQDQVHHIMRVLLLGFLFHFPHEGFVAFAASMDFQDFLQTFR